MLKTFAEYQYKKKISATIYNNITNNWNGMNVKKAVKRSEKKECLCDSGERFQFFV